ncbi:MAG: translation elongation factor Ts [Fibrobacteres bacterium]|nr:translation elongation factor Ts [Fibrobacterota bacterium]
MAEMNAAIVKELRDKSGAGMMQCKKALIECNGDMEAAMDYLRKQGQVAAGKRADRVAKEGKVGCHVGADSAVMVELNSETDFVSRNDDFGLFLNDLIKVAAEAKPASLEAFEATTSPVFGNRSVKDVVTEKIAVIGENIGIRRVSVMEKTAGTKIFSYIHMGGKIGILLRLKAENAAALESPEASELGKDVCLHVCALAPLAIDSTGISSTVVEKERAIYRDIAIQEGKPEKILDKIVQGKVDKFYKDNCLLDQLFVKDPEKTVRDVIAAAAKTLGTTITVDSFIRFQLGAASQE